MSTDRSATSEVACPKPRVRDRIFDTACKLFYKHGIRDVGVDMIATEAGTNKMSFYRSFASKDDLVAEYLACKSHAFWTWWEDIVAGHPDDPRRQIEALFEAFVVKQCAELPRGCPLANASVELAGAEHPGRQIALRQMREMRRRFRELAAGTGAARPDELGDGLMLLIEGGSLMRQAFGSDTGPQHHAARAAQALVSVYTQQTHR